EIHDHAALRHDQLDTTSVQETGRCSFHSCAFVSTCLGYCQCDVWALQRPARPVAAPACSLGAIAGVQADAAKDPTVAGGSRATAGVARRWGPGPVDGADRAGRRGEDGGCELP